MQQETVNAIPSVLLERVFATIDQKVSADERGLVQTLVSTLFKNISQDDLRLRNASDLYGQALSLWQLLRDAGPEQHFIRVFNPEISQHGWQSSHTVVQLVVPDMPFLVDSLRIVFKRSSLSPHFILHSPFHCKRNQQNQLTEFVESTDDTGTAVSQTVVLVEIDRQSDEHSLTKLHDDIQTMLNEVALIVTDWQPMRAKLQGLSEELTDNGCTELEAEVVNAKRFLNWLNDHNFTLMGYRYYQVEAVTGDHQWYPDNSSSLGLMKNSISDHCRLLSSLSPFAQKELLSKRILILTKTNRLSGVHRPAYMDYIGIKVFNQHGELIGEHRFIGLFASSFYNSSVQEIPLLQEKVAKMTELVGFEQQSHAYKSFINIVETYPRDELLQTSEEQLAEIVSGVFQMQERGITKLFVRGDAFGRYYSCMVYVPREKYNTRLRQDTQKLFQETFGSSQTVEFNTYFSESVYARTHYIVRVNNDHQPPNVQYIEDNLVELSKTWSDQLTDRIAEAYGESKSKEIARAYAEAFSRSYTENHLPSAALVDIALLQGLNDHRPLDMLFYRQQEEPQDSTKIKLKLYHLNDPIHLSDVLPTLEHFGLRVIDEKPYNVLRGDGHAFWIMDFSMTHPQTQYLSIEDAQRLFQTAFAEVISGTLEDDSFNRLVLGAQLSGRDVSILRAYAKYTRQIGSTLSMRYIATCLLNHIDIARDLIQLFYLRFDPSSSEYSIDRENQLVRLICQQLENVTSLDDDRIIRRFVDLIQATLRTNFFQLDDAGMPKSNISFKLAPKRLPDMPLPLPEFEIFVYSPTVEGVHLRGGKVARGGLRWSDRREDYRTEVLGLVKAQQVKNTVIVPVGAKGGFVCKSIPKDATREQKSSLGKACYQVFIRSLLDLTDNIVDGSSIAPEQVVCHDEPDPYLVVAADKGTATFSDTANEIAQSYSFWLGDAFASGGSVGYDHKKMGITAKGAWESVKRHFRELGIDCQTTEHSCVGIGDMGGDVFGNGMLLSPKTRIICAFNHLHVFFDPDPDTERCFIERQRLFADPSLSWADFDGSIISSGGGVFSRSAKSIQLTPEMKAWLATDEEQLTPNEFIHLALKMPVDLIWNGGIGTYVKGSTESHSDVGDRANDGLRVNGYELKAKIFGEGGNLGATQLGRIEYAAQGGMVNTDFVDNVGGVDCSDNEVNIKILLNTLVKHQDITLKQRNELLNEMTDDVANIVLQDCYRQTLSISIAKYDDVRLVKEQLRFIHYLEKQQLLNRELEFIPSDDQISERIAKGLGFTRPELSVLVAYSKMQMKETLNIPELTENSYFEHYVLDAFPSALSDRFKNNILQHPLRNEIIATKLANELCNIMGFNFVFRTQEETGASVKEIACAYVVMNGVFGIERLWQDIERLDNQISASLQLELFDSIRRMMRRTTRWYLRHGEQNVPINESIARYGHAYAQVAEELPNYLINDEWSLVETRQQRLIDQQVPEQIAHQVAIMSNMLSVMDLVQLSEQLQRPLNLVARLYYQLGAQMELHWFLEQINAQSVANHWQALARASYREDLDWQQRRITQGLLQANDSSTSADQLLTGWLDAHPILVGRWRTMLGEFKTSKTHEFAKFSVAMRELAILSEKVKY